MRPKLLEIEGLQSFKELQKIDFDVIGETGLFGIFGPTGSGKSTILDAITFALYGKVKRAGDSTQGIINTNLDTTKVRFTFEILKDGIRKTFRVDRIYKRKRGKSNIQEDEKNVLSGSEPKVVRLIEVLGDGEIPICDKTSEVNKKIEELLGLNHKDFTRAVVLPQNNFQEFLFLNNADRRDMLERIFYLEDYGKQLMEKITRKVAGLKSTTDKLAGELNAYQDATDDELKKLEKFLKEKASTRKKLEKEFIILEKEYITKKEIWNLMVELNEIQKQEKNILKLKDTIDEKSKKLDSALKAEPLIEMIKNNKEKYKELCDRKRKIEQCDNDLPKIDEQLKKIKEESNILNQSLKFRKEMQESLSMETQLISMESNMREYSDKKKSLLQELGLFENKLKNIKISISKLEKEYNILMKDELNNMVYLISQTLKEGEVCPICGGEYHANNLYLSQNIIKKNIDNNKLKKINDDILSKKLSERGFLTKIELHKKSIEELKEKIKEESRILEIKREEYTLFLNKYNIDNIQNELSRMNKADENIKELELKIKGYETRKNDIVNQKICAMSEYNIYSKQFEEDSKKTKIEMEKNQFTSSKEVEKSVLTEEQKLNLKSEIDIYNQKKIELAAQKKSIEIKLDCRSIDEEEWKQLSNKYEKCLNDKQEAISQNDIAKTMYEQLKEKNAKWLQVSKKYNELIDKQRLFAELRKVLNGDLKKDNSFIDYIAEERLRYVAKKASELLSVMTRYKFALELDIDSGFIIRDNSNGGVRRMVNSLSGGETFLTALALALALSEQIQLKGQSPLEFFFLDEGFGTLDNELLDTVIDALERISKKERIIGIISHVPELKQRISRRVIVTPPMPDGVGSIIKVEKA